MRRFLLPMDKMVIGEISTRDRKNVNKEVIGQTTYVQLDYMGGNVVVEVDPGYAEANLKIGSEGTATVQMEPCMSAKNIQTKDGREFNIIATGFENFKLVGFQPDGNRK